MSPVVKKNNVLQLNVDAASERSVSLKQSRSAGAKETVYIGGMPSESTHKHKMFQPAAGRKHERSHPVTIASLL